MAEIVNLRQARKRKARTEKELAAEQNRIRHGRPLSERERQRLEHEKADRTLDAHRLEPRHPAKPRS